ncbi:MAG TPA: hypothetical protein VM511_08255, partial [Luteolibacter sp.]|nr:hypothetical protein [Luteolibacter sp.]
RTVSRVLETRPFAAPVLLYALDLQMGGLEKFQIPEGFAMPSMLRDAYLPRLVITGGGGREIIVCRDGRCVPFSEEFPFSDLPAED